MYAENGGVKRVAVAGSRFEVDLIRAIFIEVYNWQKHGKAI
jgi:hypothetical protein